MTGFKRTLSSLAEFYLHIVSEIYILQRVYVRLCIRKFVVNKTLLYLWLIYSSCSVYISAADGISPYYRRRFLDGIPLYYNCSERGEHFGNALSLKLVERMVSRSISDFGSNPFLEYRIKLLTVGSIMHVANEHDVIWGTGISGKYLNKENYRFKHLDIRAVRGPLTRQFLIDNFAVACPEVYGEPILLLPYLFFEFKRQSNPSYPYLIVCEPSEEYLFTGHLNKIFLSESCDALIKKMLESQFVISSSLYAIAVAEAWGIPARLLRIKNDESMFKYDDYYLGTGRPHFQYATSIDEALRMGGEVPIKCDLEKLYHAFPFELWDNVQFKKQVSSQLGY